MQAEFSSNITNKTLLLLFTDCLRTLKNVCVFVCMHAYMFGVGNLSTIVIYFCWYIYWLNTNVTQ